LELVAAVGLVAALAAFCWSLLPLVPPIDQSLVISVGALLVLVWPPTVLWLVTHKELTRGRYGPWGPAIESVSPILRAGLLVLGVVLVLGWLTSLPWILKGNPERQQSQYFFFNHGSITEVSRSDYEASMAAHDRFAGAILTGFFLGAHLTLRAARRSPIRRGAWYGS
jgi:hypothetical protein